VKEDAKEEAKEHGIDKDSTEHGHMAVTHLKDGERELFKVTLRKKSYQHQPLGA
jgi:hypothetical protein